MLHKKLIAQLKKNGKGCDVTLYRCGPLFISTKFHGFFLFLLFPCSICILRIILSPHTHCTSHQHETRHSITRGVQIHAGEGMKSGEKNGSDNANIRMSRILPYTYTYQFLWVIGPNALMRPTTHTSSATLYKQQWSCFLRDPIRASKACSFSHQRDGCRAHVESSRPMIAGVTFGAWHSRERGYSNMLTA